jgi:hypothetical protein
MNLGRKIQGGIGGLWTAAIALGLAGPAGGCAGSAPGVDFATPVEGGESSTLRASAVDPLASTARAYEIVGEDESRMRIAVSPANEEGEWLMVRRLGGSGEVVRTDRFRRGEDGAALLMETVNHERDRLTRFEPPLPLVPSEIEAGETLESEHRVTVRPARDPNTIDQSGDATFRVTLIGRDRVETGGGDVTAHHVRTILRADLGVARATFEADRWWSEGFGLVAERLDERIAVFGIQTSRSSTRLRLSEEAGGGS